MVTALAVETCTAPGCHADTGHPDVRLCGDHVTDLETALHALPLLAHSLEAAYLHQQRFSVAGIGIPDPDESTLPYDDQAGRARRDLTRTLLRWWLRVHDEADHQPYAHPMTTPATVEQMTDYLLWHIPWFATDHQAGQAVLDFRRVVAKAETACDRPPDLLYLGVCSMPGEFTVEINGVTRTVDECPRDLYAVEGKTHARCPLCHHQHDVANRQNVLLNNVRPQLASAADIARGLSGLGVNVTAARIRQWKARGRLIARGTTEQPLYVVGDVIDLVSAEAEAEARRATNRRTKPSKPERSHP